PAAVLVLLRRSGAGGGAGGREGRRRRPVELGRSGHDGGWRLAREERMEGRREESVKRKVGMGTYMQRG
uniref:Uncharacterized protein n=1 Tax=Oryza brachyantha TaxID=4533 RepID=J3LJ32_ORYBR